MNDCYNQIEVNDNYRDCGEVVTENKMKHIKIVLLLIISTFLLIKPSIGAGLDPLNDAHVHVVLSVSGPVFPDSLLMMSISIKAKDKSFLEKIEAIPEWWKYITPYYQTISLSSLSQNGAPSEPRDASKSWRFKPVLTSPLDNPSNGIMEVYGGYVLKKAFSVEIPAYTKRAGTLFITLGIFDTREAAKTSKVIPSLYIASMGVSLFQIHDKSILKSPEVKQRYSESQFRAELLQGNFKKAEEWIQKYTGAGGDPVIAAEFHLKVLLYQHKFEEAYEQYKKMADMDAE